ncbi:hypothetical protein COLO4_25440 [Corchorus olitorius]|uniref:Uncharacterized protein n=1 Tax=Corchorus olitorius TaxID=93759 RepID=A0A1R3I2T8_9ROSI|nr:hypothetical protein COLO4_25440 [Corchorus olitorius]
MELEMNRSLHLHALFPDLESPSPNNALNAQNLALPETQTSLRSCGSSRRMSPTWNYVAFPFLHHNFTESNRKSKPPNTPKLPGFKSSFPLFSLQAF